MGRLGRGRRRVHAPGQTPHNDIGSRLLRIVAGLAPFAVVGALAPAALGHAALLESSPAPGARVETSPRDVTLAFSEPLVPQLTSASLVDTGAGERVPAAVVVTDGDRIVLRPRRRLERGPYRIEWHTVSPQDGHALEGSVGFGVRAAASGARSLERGPLERGGGLRVAVRALFYAALIFFAGGILTAAALGARRSPVRWLLPAAIPSAAVEQRLTRRTVDAGLLAASAGIGATVLEALDAGGGRLSTIDDFVFSSAAGQARLATVVALLAAVAVCRRGVRTAGVLVAIALAGVALAGHANSADARLEALVSDWAHLLAGSVWIGGLAHVAVAWWRPTRSYGARADALREVLPRFGAVALPAFVVVAVTGTVNALIQLGEPAALWTTGYGRVLAVKVVLVALVAAASYVHAMRLRPRLLNASPGHWAERAERRHWRLVRAEPMIGAGVVAGAALLVAFPLPPRQLVATEAAAAAQAAACDPCPQRAAAPGELAVAEPAGRYVVAAWLRREGPTITGEIRVLGRKARPAPVRTRLIGLGTRRCGTGCVRFRAPSWLPALVVDVEDGDRTYQAKLPARWRRGADRGAARLLVEAQRTMRRLRSFRQEEDVTSGPGTFARTTYRFRAPDRMAYVTDRGVKGLTIGDRDWVATPDAGWGRLSGRRPLPFRTRAWFRWSPFSASATLIAMRHAGRRRIAELALFDHGTPAWYRLWIETATGRVRRVRMVADGHFMWQRFGRFDAPVRIAGP